MYLFYNQRITGLTDREIKVADSCQCKEQDFNVVILVVQTSIRKQYISHSKHKFSKTLSKVIVPGTKQ